jgi:hypothetical protein
MTLMKERRSTVCALGWAITLAFSDSPLTDMMVRVGWASNQTTSNLPTSCPIILSLSHLLAAECHDIQDLTLTSNKNSPFPKIITLWKMMV